VLNLEGIFHRSSFPAFTTQYQSSRPCATAAGHACSSRSRTTTPPTSARSR
jgi:hypothetical protein